MRHTNRETLEHTGAVVHPLNAEQGVGMAIGKVSTHSPKDTLFWEGDPADDVFKVIRGTVCLYQLLPDGRRQVSRFCHAGDLIGLTATETYPYTADALTNLTTVRIRRSQLDTEMEGNPAVRGDVLRAIQDELNRTQNQLLLLGRKTAVERVASFLSAMSEQAMRDGGDGRAVELPMTRVDIADYLGLTHETVCRVLGQLKRDGVVGIPDPHRIELRQLDVLEDFAEGECGIGCAA